MPAKRKAATKKAAPRKSSSAKRTAAKKKAPPAKRTAGSRRAGVNPLDRVLNCEPSRDPESDWGFEQAAAAGTVAMAAQLPPSVDLREGWWGINDQGATGSCVGQATADGLCRWHFVKAGGLGTSQLLSIRYVWMAAKETDASDNIPSTFLEADGTSLKAALDIVRKYGVVTAKELPFAGALYGGDPRTFFAIAATRKITSYYRLQQSEWKEWLANTGPIMARLDVDSTWDKASATRGVLATYKPPGRGGHAVTIVGYTPTHFVVRNSWGTTWGDKGFAYATPTYAKKAFTESYGIRVG